MPNSSWLTVRLVEEIQEAVQAGHSVSSVVTSLQQTTLPALLEYGCLRWKMNSDAIPPLPPTIVSSPLGKALRQVTSELGLRKSGDGKRAQRHIAIQEMEFCALQCEEEIDERTWQEFEIRFDRSAQSAGFSSSAAHRLQAALHEMAENALIHAEAPVAVLVGYRVFDGIALFSIADVGRGVLASLRTNSSYQHLQTDKDAIREAIQDGVSRFGEKRGGLGFRRVFKALLEQWGYLRFRSGNGCVTMDGTDLDADKGEIRFPPPLPGFQVTVCCRTADSIPNEPLV